MNIDEKALAEAIDEDDFSGVAAVHQNGERVLARCAGYAHRAHGIEVTPDTRFGIASGSKAFTALAAMRLVEQGTLTLDAPVRPWLGDDLPLVDDAVTLEHLLTHTSGIGDYLDESGDGDITDYILTTPVHRLVTAADFIAELDGHAQQEKPGDTFRYNNGGYMVAAIVIERAAKSPFQDVVADLVLKPAGLTATAYERSDDLPADASLHYLEPHGNRTNVLHLPVRGGGDGGAFTSADDLDRFWRAFAAGDIVSNESVEQMVRPRHDVPDEGLRYGMGFWLHATGPAWVIEGYDAGVSFRSTHDAQRGLTATVLGNTPEGAWPVIGVLADLFD